jgi:hypothetical protein
MVSIYKDIDIDVDEFISSCDDGDIKEMIDILSDLGYLHDVRRVDDNVGYMEKGFQDNLDKLKDVFYRMGEDEIGLIESLVKKYC